MGDLDDFLTPTLAHEHEAEQALINGDPEPRLAMWATQDPVTVFRGGEERHRIRGGAPGLSLAGDAVLQLHRQPHSMHGGPIQPITLRVTHVTAARTATGRSSIAMPTPPSVDGRHHGQGDQLWLTILQAVA